MPSSTARYAFLCVAIFLIVWPLTVQKPGLPFSLKADEPAYYLIARSLWEDHDLYCEPKDLVRASDDYAYRIENLILGTKDGWQTAFYAKPYVASLLAAPMVAAFGANGFVAFNMFLFLLAVWMSAVYLGRENGFSIGLLFSAAYLFLSASFNYVFWLQPETTVLFFLTLGLFFTFHEFTGPTGGRIVRGDGREPAWTRFAQSARWWVVGIAAGPVITTKPPYALMFLPSVVGVLRSRSRSNLIKLAVATTISSGSIALGQQALTGTWSPYLGALRRGFGVSNPNQMPTAGARSEVLEADPEELFRLMDGSAAREELHKRNQRGSDWSWIFSMPLTVPERFPLDLLTFLVGRHTGMLPYYPFIAIAFIMLFTGGGWRDPRRWAILLGLAGVATFLLVWHYENYHGGGGFVGNRYFAPIQVGGLFLVRRIRPRPLVAVGTLVAALFLGQIVFAPLGVAVDEPTLQAYARAVPFRWLPFEVNLGPLIPGQRGISQGELWLSGRKDRVRSDGEWVYVIGPGETELWANGQLPSNKAVFLFRTHVSGNVVRTRFGKAKHVVRFPATTAPPEGFSRIVQFDLGEPDRRFRMHLHSEPQSYWRFTLDPEHASRPMWWGGDNQQMVGVQFVYLGDPDHLAQDVYGVEWLRVVAPEVVTSGQQFQITAELRNTSSVTWDRESFAQVRLAYRWRDAEGREIPTASLRGQLSTDLAPGETTEVSMNVVAPEQTGTLTLNLEPVFEYVRWFGDVNPDTRHPLTLCVDER